MSESLEANGFLKTNLHMTGFENILKLIEYDLSNFPFGYSCGLSLEHSLILRSSRRLMDKTTGDYYDFSNWLSGNSKSLLASNVMYFKQATSNVPSFRTMGRVVSLKLRRDEFPKGAEDEYCSPGKSSTRKQIVDGVAKSLVELIHAEDPTSKKDMKKGGKLIKTTRDVKTDAESDSELRSRIELLLDEGSTCKRCCFQSLSFDPRQTKYVDVLNSSWDIVEKRNREMSKFDYVFPGWSKFLASSWSGESFCSNYMFLEIKRDRNPVKPTHNSGGSSHYRQIARAVYTGACSFYASLSTHGGTVL